MLAAARHYEKCFGFFKLGSSMKLILFALFTLGKSRKRSWTVSFRDFLLTACVKSVNKNNILLISGNRLFL